MIYNCHSNFTTYYLRSMSVSMWRIRHSAWKQLIVAILWSSIEGSWSMRDTSGQVCKHTHAHTCLTSHIQAKWHYYNSHPVTFNYCNAKCCLHKVCCNTLSADNLPAGYDRATVMITSRVWRREWQMKKSLQHTAVVSRVLISSTTKCLIPV